MCFFFVCFFEIRFTSTSLLCWRYTTRRAGHVLCALSSSLPCCSLRLINNTVLAILAFPPLPLILPCFGPVSPPFWLPGHGSACWGPHVFAPSIVCLRAPLCLLRLNRGLRRHRACARPRSSCLRSSKQRFSLRRTLAS